MDAGDLLEVLVRSGVNVVLAGHKHVPYVWRLEDMYLASAGTCSSLRVRGHTKPCYNVLEIDGGEVTIFRKFPFGERQQMAQGGDRDRNPDAARGREPRAGLGQGRGHAPAAPPTGD